MLEITRGICGLCNADPGWRAIYRDSHGKLRERPVQAWALCEVAEGRGRNRRIVAMEARALIARYLGSKLEIAGDECLGYAEPHQTADEFLVSQAAELGVDRFGLRDAADAAE